MTLHVMATPAHIAVLVRGLLPPPHRSPGLDRRFPVHHPPSHAPQHLPVRAQRPATRHHQSTVHAHTHASSFGPHPQHMHTFAHARGCRLFLTQDMEYFRGKVLSQLQASMVE